MAVAGDEGLGGTRLVSVGAALALLSILVYLSALCAICKRKGRKKKIPPDGVKLVDESLLRQTQLRSLSKSDTKLHELYRVKVRDAAQRPASLDFPCLAAPPANADSLSILLHRELPQIPVPEPPAASPAPDQTYSNLLFAPLRKPGPDTVYECLAVGEEGAPVPPVTTSTQLEEMYSTVCKATKKKTQVPSSSPREAGAGRPPPRREERAPAGCWSPAAQGPPDPCYESVSGRAWTAQGRGPEPDYEAVDGNWKKAAKREKPGKAGVPENLYESVGDVWAGESRRGPARTAANGLEVYITNL